MSFIYEEKSSASRFVDVVWRTEDTSDGTYLAAADGCWDMVFITAKTATTVLVSGPSSKVTPVPYRAGNRNFGIRFKHGSFLTHVPASAAVDVTQQLHMPSPATFLLAGIEWSLPTYDTIDAFLAELEQRGLLSDDPIVRTVTDGEALAASTRSIQRHFDQVTGLSPSDIRQIDRARRAVKLLQRGRPITEVAHDLGYADQAHMTRLLRRLTGYTPKQNAGRDEPI